MSWPHELLCSALTHSRNHPSTQTPAVPIIAAILPIRQALGTTLTDALDISRNRVAAVAVTTTRCAHAK